ncbi:MAG: hypothetical protein ACREFP_19585 [Acetobacteraceae bacterium]
MTGKRGFDVAISLGFALHAFVARDGAWHAGVRFVPDEALAVIAPREAPHECTAAFQ